MAKAKPITERLASIKAQREKLAAKERQLEAKDRSEQRKRETRRKIVVGSAVLNQLDKDPALARTVARLLATFVTRDHDKEVISDILTHLPPPPANETAAPPPAAGEFAKASAAASVPAHAPAMSPFPQTFDVDAASAALRSAIFSPAKSGSTS